MALTTNASPYPFLWDDTSATSGLLISAVSVMTTELNSLVNASVKVSVATFLNTAFAQAIWADAFYSNGATAYVGTLAAGANWAFWFLTSPDAGTTFESATVAPPRPPDFIIPLPAATSLAASSVFAARNVMLPALATRVLAQNNTGQTAPSAAAPYLKIAPYGMQY